MSTLTFESVHKLQKNYDEWRRSLNPAKMLAFSLIIAALTGIAAQIKMPLPGTPVPITLQSFMVLLAGLLLGKNWGGLSQVFYVGLGAIGVPWFAGATGGFAYLMGPTTGYLIGFIVSAFVIGWLYDKSSETRKWLPMLGIMIISNLFIVYGFGLAYLAFWLSAIKGSSFDFINLLWMGALPFLLGDLLKILAASFVGNIISHKQQ